MVQQATLPPSNDGEVFSYHALEGMAIRNGAVCADVLHKQLDQPMQAVLAVAAGTGRGVARGGSTQCSERLNAAIKYGYQGSSEVDKVQGACKR